MMTGVRRKARTLALQVLYEIDTSGHKADDVTERLLIEEDFTEENEAFIRDIVFGVIAHKEKLDQSIRKHAPAWPIEQLPVIDRNILRLAIFEILIDNRVPVKVAINEAVELAKKAEKISINKYKNVRRVNFILCSMNIVQSLFKTCENTDYF